MKTNINRREFLKRLGLGSAAVAGATMTSCSSDKIATEENGEIPTDKMTYRVTPSTGDHVSLLGYGCMRWPNDSNGAIDQEMVNKLVDYAMEHGVNYYDTSPVYCQGHSEEATGIALSRHPRDKYFIATKLSNFHPSTWSYEKSVEMIENSKRYLQTDYIDYLLLHSIGGSSRDLEGRELDGMETLNARFFDNGIMDYLVAEREAGRIRNLGFSYHGDIRVFDYLLSLHDKYKWDFVQIQLNYVDWQHAKAINPSNTNGEYLYEELHKRGIPAVIMEPLLGGRLAQLPGFAAAKCKQKRPEKSIASWAFRFAGTPEGVLTVLSGMTYMEHLQDNLRQYCPFEPCSQEEMEMLLNIGEAYVNRAYIPCTACQYCMPCPYGIDIPSIFTHYNKCINEGNYDVNPESEEYKKARRAFLLGYDRSVPALRQASHCIGCGQCMHHCPQRINIPEELHRIDQYVEDLKVGMVAMSQVVDALKENPDVTLAVGKGSKIKTFNQKGVKDLPDLYDNDRRFLNGSMVADKIIGKGAAAFMIAAGVKQVWTDKATTDAMKMFGDAGIPIVAEQTIPQVKNRTNTGRCPVDTLCAPLDSPHEMIDAIRSFYATQS